MDNSYQQIVSLAKARGVIRPRDVTALGLPRVAVYRLAQRGQLQKVGHGLYTVPDREVTENNSLAEVARKHPHAIICLLSALRFHELTTQSPHEVWIAIPNKARPPQMDHPPLRVVRFSGVALSEGIQEQMVEGVPVQMTTIARTVADCFKFRNKIGLDVAIEALQAAWQGKRIQMDELWRFASVCRVTNIIRPYLESLG